MATEVELSPLAVAIRDGDAVALTALLEQALREADDREIARVRAVRPAEEAYQESNPTIR